MSHADVEAVYEVPLTRKSVVISKKPKSRAARSGKLNCIGQIETRNGSSQLVFLFPLISITSCPRTGQYDSDSDSDSENAPETRDAATFFFARATVSASIFGCLTVLRRDSAASCTCRLTALRGASASCACRLPVLRAESASCASQACRCSRANKNAKRQLFHVPTPNHFALRTFTTFWLGWVATQPFPLASSQWRTPAGGASPKKVPGRAATGSLTRPSR
mmetsp:Transcript_155258/g.289618  ORF Transcript_155258/g.289618 Transcript_155258/m.289618 type:complete len:221 (+) Transcript_155258:454-1116(+)